MIVREKSIDGKQRNTRDIFCSGPIIQKIKLLGSLHVLVGDFCVDGCSQCRRRRLCVVSSVFVIRHVARCRRTVLPTTAVRSISHKGGPSRRTCGRLQRAARRRLHRKPRCDRTGGKKRQEMRCFCFARCQVQLLLKSRVKTFKKVELKLFK
jgi:hypothetical protein